MRVLGLDVGERRIGVAAGDTDSPIAVAVGAVDRNEHDPYERLAELARERDVSLVVVGLPLSMSGRRGPQADVTLAFAEELKDKTRLAIETVDERLSSIEAERRIRETSVRGRGRATRPEKGAIDAGAAVLILQSWLDRRTHA